MTKLRTHKLWDFTASAVGEKGFGENQSAILASCKIAPDS
jgi:hypothetical protein